MDVAAELRRYAELTQAAIREELARGEVSDYLAGPLAEYPQRGRQRNPTRAAACHLRQRLVG